MFVQRAIPRAVASAMAVALLASACGSSGEDPAAESSPVSAEAGAESTQPTNSANAIVSAPVEATGETVDVVALDNTFRPERIEVVAGTAVRWENRGRNDHDVVPADEALTWGVDAAGFAPGDEYTLLFDTPGEFPYFCSIHGTKDVGMIGTVVVIAAGG